MFAFLTSFQEKLQDKSLHFNYKKFWKTRAKGQFHGVFLETEPDKTNMKDNSMFHPFLKELKKSGWWVRKK